MDARACKCANALTCDLNMFGKELFAESKVQALEMKINLLAVPQVIMCLWMKKYNNSMPIIQNSL